MSWMPLAKHCSTGSYWYSLLFVLDFLDPHRSVRESRLSHQPSRIGALQRCDKRVHQIWSNADCYSVTQRCTLELNLRESGICRCFPILCEAGHDSIW